MATFIQTLKAALEPLVAGHAWYQANTAEPPTFPFITFARVVSVPNVALEGVSAMQSTRVQVDIFSRSVDELEGLCEAVDAAVAAAFPQSVPLSSQDLYEEPVRAHRSLREFSVWSDL